MKNWELEEEMKMRETGAEQRGSKMKRRSGDRRNGGLQTDVMWLAGVYA